MKKFFSVIALVLIMTIALCGCGGNTGNNEAGQTGNEGTGSSGEPTMGGELTVGISSDLDASLDPHVSSSSAGTREVLYNVYEGLVKSDSDGNLVPAVAASYDVNETADVYTFTLREGVKFHNGQEVTSEDVLFSLSRAAGLETGEALVGDVAGIAAVEATDDKTIVVTLKAPDTEFLAHITTAIIPKDADPAKDVIGTGPFKLTERKAGEGFTLEKFADYWGEPAYLDKVTFKVIDNAETMTMSLRSGAVDMAYRLVASQVADLSDMNVLEGSSNIVQALYLNHKVKPFDDEKVRKALCYAIDKQAVIDLACDGYGTALGSSMFPAFKKYFMDDLTNYYEQDTAKAKELLAEAGYPNGFEFTITVPSNMKQHVDTAQVLVEMFKEIGVTAKINQVEWTTWVTEAYQGRQFEATVVGMDAHGVAASDLLARFTSDHGKNFINYNDPEYDAAYKEAISTVDDAAQTEAFKKCERILTEKAANCYIQDTASFVALKKGIGGYEFFPLYVQDFAKLYYEG
ncbi:MAG: ABC transporter substrate-binding protein [Clostridia bacterium]|nr:ABC transporter substrate-binding protein [Clostridia bacterium]